MVWSQAKDDDYVTGDLNVGDDFDRLFRALSRDVFLVKMSYWLGY